MLPVPGNDEFLFKRPQIFKNNEDNNNYSSSFNLGNRPILVTKYVKYLGCRLIFFKQGPAVFVQVHLSDSHNTEFIFTGTPILHFKYSFEEVSKAEINSELQFKYFAIDL